MLHPPYGLKYQRAASVTSFLEFAVKAFLVFLIAALDEELPEFGQGLARGRYAFRDFQMA